MKQPGEVKKMGAKYKQTRKSVSVSGDLYREMQKRGQAAGKAISELVEDQMRSYLRMPARQKTGQREASLPPESMAETPEPKAPSAFSEWEKKNVRSGSGEKIISRHRSGNIVTF